MLRVTAAWKNGRRKSGGLLGFKALLLALGGRPRRPRWGLCKGLLLGGGSRGTSLSWHVTRQGLSTARPVPSPGHPPFPGDGTPG